MSSSRLDVDRFRSEHQSLFQDAWMHIQEGYNTVEVDEPRYGKPWLDAIANAWSGPKKVEVQERSGKPESGTITVVVWHKPLAELAANAPRTPTPNKTPTIAEVDAAIEESFREVLATWHELTDSPYKGEDVTAPYKSEIWQGDHNDDNTGYLPREAILSHITFRLAKETVTALSDNAEIAQKLANGIAANVRARLLDRYPSIDGRLLAAKAA